MIGIKKVSPYALLHMGRPFFIRQAKQSCADARLGKGGTREPRKFCVKGDKKHPISQERENEPLQDEVGGTKDILTDAGLVLLPQLWPELPVPAVCCFFVLTAAPLFSVPV